MTPQPLASFVVLGDGTHGITELARLDPDRDWRKFVTTTSAWILQTCLRLRSAGYDVELRDTLPSAGIAVLGAGDYREALRRWRWQSSAALIAVAQGSHRRIPPFADAAIVQNLAQADDARSYFMMHWPQPGLVPRDPARGARIERAAFKGFTPNLDPAYRGEAWLGFLRDQHIEWMHDAVPYADQRTETVMLQFPDYRTVDLVLAVRPPHPDMYPDRPATKLVNAWLAGVPAILGPELAYRALRRTPLDYLEVASVAEAQAAVLNLRHHPDLYLAMVGNGQQRAREFTPGRVTQLWHALLVDRLPRLARDPAVARTLGRPLWMRQLHGRWRSTRNVRRA